MSKNWWYKNYSEVTLKLSHFYDYVIYFIILKFVRRTNLRNDAQKDQKNEQVCSVIICICQQSPPDLFHETHCDRHNFYTRVLDSLQKHTRKSVTLRASGTASMLKISTPRKKQSGKGKKSARRVRFYEAKLCAQRTTQSNTSRKYEVDDANSGERPKCCLVRRFIPKTIFSSYAEKPLFSELNKNN